MRGKPTEIVEIARDLARAVNSLEFSPPVTHVYNPLDYAAKAHESYLMKYGTPPKRVVFMGMNPGPWGMAQTGVPFGDVRSVREWLAIDEPIGKPDHEHPRRPVLGLDCLRVEVSGSRLWSWARDSFASPGDFFKDYFVINYCPLVFMEAGGRNRTPDRLPIGERKALMKICDAALEKTIAALRPQWLIGVGQFARKRAESVFRKSEVNIGAILHPSPASPAANRGWQKRIIEQLSELDILH